ncbi:M14 family zinc carboxypeptidase [Metabacillus halosaccharovorans]|uniref:M14 family zinc carboxypeptidase n=1 Tax=Metabacillus halosaccharovorans TaxID=930124 RepID=UPI00203EF423|nr:M14 family zinc carboxypeptidase [Metabacillus halosaccharovorans]MCM3443779.1 hypothetical protein [Metabacillus halosaccharovorans]
MIQQNRKIVFNVLLVLILSLLCISLNNKATASNKIVNPQQVYTYEIMTNDILKLARKYPNLIEYKSLGKTKYGRTIWAVKLGKGSTNVFINGSHHAREWLTTNLNMKMIEEYAISYSNNTYIGPYHTKSILNNTSIWFVPMVNPDGVTLQQFGLNAFPSFMHSNLLKMNDGNTNFKRWKANLDGIDLNRQYNTGWSTIKSNVSRPYYMNHKGTSPAQTNETKILVDFTYEIKPEIAVSYHSAGRILYWNYKTPTQNYDRDYELAKEVSNLTNYSLVPLNPNPSGGGYTDWFIQTFKKPALTPEISYYPGETNPPLSVFNEEWSRNRTVGLHVAKRGYELAAKNYKKVNYYITTFKNVTLYNTPSTISKTSSIIKPQSLKVTREYDNWLEINTWLGPKWIKTSNYIKGKEELYNQPITLTQKTTLYNSPMGSKTHNSLGAQQVKATTKINDWYKIKTWLGDKWINPQNAIIGTVEKINTDIQLIEKVNLFDLPFAKYKKSTALNPQKVHAVAKWNDWYQINTWLGPKWITPKYVINGTINTINEEINLIEKVTLYNQPFTDFKTSAVLNAQKVHVVAEWNNWYKVNTWLGYKWIKPKYIIDGNIEKFNTKITLVDQITLYNQPFEDFKTKASINPQTISAIAKWNDWYQINTWLGPKWIKPKNLIIGDIEVIEEQITLVDKQYLYNQPFEGFRENSAVNPQTITAIAKWNNWYKINTWLGPKWINPEYLITGNVQVINEAVILQKTTDLYNQPFEDFKTSTSIAPQTIVAIEKWNNWYKINTWLGTKWIKAD